MKGAIAFFVSQLLLLGMLIFGDIGFDHPGKYGLDFDDFLKIAIFYAGCLLAGVLYAGFRRQWKVLILQIATPLLLWFVMVVAPQHLPPLDPADYQHLVGKTEKEVREAIGSWRMRASGFGGDENGEYGFENYDGMSIYYTRTREPRVTSVQAN
jgi:hypothetical protein